MTRKTETFGQRIRSRRLDQGWSQRELAERVAARLQREDQRGFDFTYLSKIENNKLLPSAAVISQLAIVLGDDEDELMGLAAKAPADLGETLSKSAGARAFFRSAVNKKLSEAEWRRLLKQLEGKRK